MSEVTQTILFDAELNRQGVIGNCLQAAVASLLDLPLDAVPHFSSFVWWPAAMELWARGRGLTVVTEDCTFDTIPTRRCIVGGWSPRGVQHVCVAEAGEITWDPHPSRDGLEGVTDAMWFEPWTHGDPACFFCHRLPLTEGETQ